MHDKACLMARAALCAMEQNKFSDAHDWIFAHQEGLNDGSIGEMEKELNLNKDTLDLCLKDNTAVKDELTREVDQGNLAGIDGTPSIFANGRLLPGGFLIPVLEAALKSSP